MKQLSRCIVLSALSLVFLLPASGDAGVRVYVRFGPPKLKTVKVIKPARPHRHAVWVKGHWVYRNGRYVYVEGHWIKGRPGHVYVQPHWVKTARGYYFVPGHWVKK